MWDQGLGFRVYGFSVWKSVQVPNNSVLRFGVVVNIVQALGK